MKKRVPWWFVELAVYIALSAMVFVALIIWTWVIWSTIMLLAIVGWNAVWLLALVIYSLVILLTMLLYWCSQRLLSILKDRRSRRKQVSRRGIRVSN